MPKKKRILIVDDDQDIIEAIRIILERGGYTVDAARDSGEALVYLTETQPDLVLLDVMMQSPDEGFQLSYRLKNDPKFASIPILLVTSVGQKTGFKFSPETDEEYLPVQGFLEKPVQPKVLLEEVGRLLK